MSEKEKKTLKVGEKSVLRLYGSLVSVLIKSCKKVDSGRKFKGEIRGRDQSTKMNNGIIIEGFVDDELNYK